jgi:hypothetical protein
MQRIIFDHSPWLILVALLIGALASWFLYRHEYNWSRLTNQILTALRFVVIFFVAVLLLGPVIRMVSNETEKPAIAIVLDQSSSMWLADSVSAKKILPQLESFRNKLTSSGYEIVTRDFSGNAITGVFQSPVSDLNGAIKQTALDFEGRNLSGIVVVSDGIYNSGVSPLYHPAATPVYTLGFGDTTQRRDLKFKSLHYNRITYLGNRFPVHAEIQVLGDLDGSFEISAKSKGRTIASQRAVIQPGNKFMPFEFLLDATEPGLQRIDFAVTPVPGEHNPQNNKFSAFIEVLDSRKKILIVAPAPHPDIKLIHTILEKNGNYEAKIYIPGVTSNEPEFVNKGRPDLVIFNQAPDLKNLTTPLVRKWMTDKIPAFFIVGEQTALKMLPTVGVPVTFESVQWDEVFGVIDSRFAEFALPDQLTQILTRMPPVTAPFGKFKYPATAKIVLNQRIGNVSTDRPLLFTFEQQEQRMAVAIAEGFWRWRLKEYDLTEKTSGTDELLLKVIQYLMASDDKSKFRCTPVQREFNEGMPVGLEVQVLDQLFEPQYNVPVKVEVWDDQNKKSVFEFTPAPGKTTLTINPGTGVFKYKASIIRNDVIESDQGVFSVIPMQLERQDLTADFNLLRQLAKATGGKFFEWGQANDLQKFLTSKPAPGRIHPVNAYFSLIDLKIIFFLLLLLISAEWFIRKYSGGY